MSVINETTAARGYPKPHPDNGLILDVPRVREALDSIDADVAALVGAVAGKVDIDSPAFTGTPTAPTAVPGTSSNQLATTAFVAAGLEPKADLLSPTLTGVPTAPTPAPGTNSSQLATTAFVNAVVAGLVNSSPAALDTLKELADALGNDPNFATTIVTSLAGKLDKIGGTLTGPLIIDNPTGGLGVRIRGAAGHTAFLELLRGGVTKASLQATTSNTVDLVANSDPLRLFSGVNMGLELNTSGIVSTPLRPRLWVNRSAGAQYSAGVIAWGSASLVTGCTWDGTNFIATHAGSYLFMGTIFAALPNAGSHSIFNFYKNGVSYSGPFHTPSSTAALNYIAVPVFTMVNMAVGDYVSLALTTANLGAGVYGGTYSTLIAMKIG